MSNCYCACVSAISGSKSRQLLIAGGPRYKHLIYKSSGPSNFGTGSVANGSCFGLRLGPLEWSWFKLHPHTHRVRVYHTVPVSPCRLSISFRRISISRLLQKNHKERPTRSTQLGFFGQHLYFRRALPSTNPPPPPCAVRALKMSPATPSPFSSPLCA